MPSSYSLLPSGTFTLIYQNIGTKYSLLSLLLQFGLKIFNDRLFKESFISKIPISDQTSLAISGVIIVVSFNARVFIDLKNGTLIEVALNKEKALSCDYA